MVETSAGGMAKPNWDELPEDIIPALDETYDLGSANKRWAYLFAVIAVLSSIIIGGVVSISTLDSWLFINASTMVNGSMNISDDAYIGGDLDVSGNIINYYNMTQVNDTIDNKLLVTFYNATSVDVAIGTLDDGDVESTWEFGNASLNVSEANAEPGMDIRVNFTGVEDFNQLIIRYRTDPESDHEVKIQLWDWINSVWCDHDFYIEATHWDNPYMPIWDSVLHVGTGANEGEVNVRIYMPGRGKPAHTHYYDFFQLSFGAATYSSVEADPLSFHKGENINATGYNISAEYFFGDGSKLLNLPTGDNASWNESYADTLYRDIAWDNFTGIPHATPTFEDTTHFSWSAEIFDWAVGLFLQAMDYTNIAMTNETNTFTAGQSLTGQNITAIDCIIFDSGGKICSGV